MARGVVERGSYTDCVKDEIKPYKVNHERFKSLGIGGKHAALNCSIVLTDGEAAFIEDSLITLGHRMSAANIAGFKAAQICLKNILLNLKGKVAWDCNLKWGAHGGSLGVAQPLQGGNIVSPG